MKNNLLKKGMVCLIIFFFIGASVLPIVTGNIGKSNVVEKELMKIKNIKQTLFDDSLGEEWTQTFGGTESDIGYSVEQTNDGGYIIAGETESYGAGKDDVWLVKTNADGIVQWNKTFGGNESDVGWSVQQTDDNGFIIVGYTQSCSQGESDVWLIKTDVDGNEQWTQTFGGTESDIGYSVEQTNDGGYIIAGETESYGAGKDDVWLVKTNADGIVQWNKTFGGTETDVGYSVIQTDDDGYIVAGYTQSYGVGWCDVWLIKTDVDGNEQWNKPLGGAKNDVGWSIQQTNDNGYIITGYTESYDVEHQDVWLIKTDVDGNEQWNHTFGGKAFDVGYSVVQTNDGGYIIAGHTFSDEAVWLIKTDEQGDKQWTKTFGGTETDVARSVQQTNDGGYIIAGYTWSYGAGDADVWLIKIPGQNQAPNKPSTAQGETDGKAGEEYTYATSTSDPDGDKIWYKWDWGDGTTSDWIGPYNSGEICEISHVWNIENDYQIKIMAKDIIDAESFWSNPLAVSISYRQAWLFGSVSNKTTTSESIKFNTELVVYIAFSPFEIRTYSVGTCFSVAKQYNGVFMEKIIFGKFNIQNIEQEISP